MVDAAVRFKAYYDAFVAVFEAELAEAEARRVIVPNDPTDEDEWTSARSAAYQREQQARRVVFAARDHLKRARNLYLSAKYPPTPGYKFYVSLIRGERVAMLAGPFETHEEALDAVDPVWKKAVQVDARAWWDSCGTCSADPAEWGEGKLNALLKA